MVINTMMIMEIDIEDRDEAIDSESIALTN